MKDTTVSDSPSENVIPSASPEPEKGGGRSKSGSGSRKKTKNPSQTPSLIVVGIGSSAGGLEALKTVLPNLPDNPGLTYIVAQHLDPKHRSMLVSLLSRDSKMEVLEARNGQELEPRKIFITPPNCEVTVSKGVLRLRKPTYSIGPKPSVDQLFVSIAEDRGENCIGIILSGTGSDGSHGIRAIRAAGGLTVAQEEKTAKYNGMPHAAIETGCVDLILPPDKIGSEISRILQYPHGRPHIPQSDTVVTAMERLFRVLRKRTGGDFSEYKLSTVRRRIERRMFANKIASLDDYVTHLEQSPREADMLFKDILISVTSFFREPEAFKAVGDIMAKVIEGKRDGENIRIWVPGCATGEEVYSLAILLSETLGDGINRFGIQIFGSDIDQEAVNMARKGVYPEASLEKVQPDIRGRYFTSHGSGFQVIKPIKDKIVFAKHDLVKDPPFSHIDLISCRNLLIYFNQSLQKRILSTFQYVLNAGGYLFLGKSETVGEMSDLFAIVDRKNKIFKKIGSYTAPLIPFALNGNVSTRTRRALVSRDPGRREPTIEEILHQNLVRMFAPPSVVINDRLEIIHVYGDVTPYLKLNQGDVNLNVLNLAPEPLRAELRALIHKSTREGASIRDRLCTPLDEREGHKLCLSVFPIDSEGDKTRLSMVCFEELKAAIAGSENAALEEGEVNPRIAELEQELMANREHLQTVIEELETSNEELQALNEELQTSNEELQSTNEELETSNEELQSTNEELLTVNEELQVKSGELAGAYADLENIQNNIGFALVVVDRDLRITRFNEPVKRFFSLNADDVGQVITSIGTSINFPDLRDSIVSVIVGGRACEKELAVEDRIYWLRIIPYVSESNRVDGAMIAIIDNTDVRMAQRRLDEKERRLSLAESMANLASWEWSRRDDQMHFSPKMGVLLGVESGKPRLPFREFLDCVHEDDRDMVRRQFEESVGAGKELTLEHRIVRLDGSVHWVSHVGHVIREHDGGAVRLVGIMMDIDDRKSWESLLCTEKAIMDSIKGRIAIIDRGFNILSANTAFQSFFGPMEEILNTNCLEVIRAKAPNCLSRETECRLVHAVRNGSSGSCNHGMSTTDGNGEVACEFSVSPIVDPRGSIDRFIFMG